MVVIDLNADNPLSSDVATIFSEVDGRLGLLENSNVSIQDGGGTVSGLSRATAHFDNPSAFDQHFERLELNVSRLPLNMQQLSHQFENGQLTINGSYTLMEYEIILQAIDYINTNQNPDDTPLRGVHFQVFDDMSLGSNIQRATISIRLYNDPPLLYLGGPSAEQQNETIIFDNPIIRDGFCVPVLGSSTVSDPDSTQLNSLCFETETNTETISSTTGILHPQINASNLYCANSLSLRTVRNILTEVLYCITTEPTSPETRTIRAFAEDNGRAISEFAFIFVTFPGSGITTQPTTTEMTSQLQHTTKGLAGTTQTMDTTPEIVSSISPTTATESLQSTSLNPTELANTPLTTSTTVTVHAACPQEDNVPLFQGTEIFLYDWLETNAGQIQMLPCPQVSVHVIN